MLELAGRRNLPSPGVLMVPKKEIVVLSASHKLSLSRLDNVNLMAFFYISEEKWLISSASCNIHQCANLLPIFKWMHRKIHT